MALDVTLSFSNVAGAGPIAGVVVHRVQLREALSELFELHLQLASTDPALDLHAVIGEAVTVQFAHEPVQTQIEGIVRGVRQLSSGSGSGAAPGATDYEIAIVPPLWLTTRRRDHRIFEDLSVLEIAAKVVAGYGQRIPAPALRASADRREYVVQYAETDHDFLARILADEGLTWFFDHESHSAWTLVDDTTQKSIAAPADTHFILPSNLSTLPPHVFQVTVAARVETSTSTTRDFTYENVKAPLDEPGEPARPGAGRQGIDELFTSEQDLEAYVFEVGKYATEADGKERATRLLQALRAAGRLYTMEANFTLGPGRQITLTEHPRADCNGTFLVTRTRVIEDDGASPAGDPITKHHLLECVPVSVPFRPLPFPKPRIHATQTAFVVGGEEGEIVSDPLGRVRVQFTWDRANQASRLVRVSQAWAGSRLGFFALPRVGDEVVVSYLDGDPDQPLIIGRVHDNLKQPPINPTGEARTISTWRSQSLKKPSGFNEVLMDDATDKERLELHAERDYARTVEHDAAVLVKHDDALTVGHDKTDTIDRAYSMSAGSVSISCGPYTISASTIKETAKTTIHIEAGDAITGKAPLVEIDGDTISLNAGGSSITLDGSGITLKGPKITIQADGDVDVDGALITLN